MQVGEYDLRQRKNKKYEIDESIGNSSLSNRKDSKGLWPDSVGIGLIVLFLIIFKSFSLLENSLPEQIKLSSANLQPGRFIGERASLQLKRLTNLGTRVVGSYENEVLAVDFLKREISFISQEAHKSREIKVDVQKPTGSYYLSFKPHGFRNYYANIQNVVVRLSSGNSTNSVLMNCHYDTVPESPGASDNGVNCVVMLEILKVLAVESFPMKNNVIFLFNGAEENPLQASHGFLQHQWSKEVKVLINLDSAGAGGREVLFQTSGEPWLVKAYAKAVPRPSAGVQGEELFHYGIIPSDTDFRVFRDFGSYSGFDIAHCSNGYIYHTKFDTAEFIRPGVYQNTGDNMLALVRELVNSSELEAQHKKTRIVYFDVFTYFVIVYTEEFGVGLNLLTVFLSVYAIWKSVRSVTDEVYPALWILCVVEVVGFISTGAFVICISYILDFYKSTMSWYLRPWLIVPLYAFPIVVALTFMLIFTQKYMKKEPLTHKIIQFINGAQLFWTFILLTGTFYGIRTSFILMLIILFPSLGSLFVTVNKKSNSAKTYLITYFCCLAFPMLFVISQTVRIFTVIIPMTARMGPHTNPEVIVGALCFLCLAVYMTHIVPILLFLRNIKKFLISLLVLHLLALAVVTHTNSSFPYDGNVQSPALQRFYVLHCERILYDARGSVIKSESGIFVQSLDRNNINYVSVFIPELQRARSASELCSTEIFCGFPVFTSRFIRTAPYSYWVPAGAPTIHHPTSLEIVNQTQTSINTRRIKILVTGAIDTYMYSFNQSPAKPLGPDHITIGISPRKEVELVKWSFDESRPIDIGAWEERKTYMVYYSHGLMGGTLEFDVDLKMDANHSGHIMDIAVVGHYMHDKKFQTTEFKNFLSKFPTWAHLTPWTTSFKSWII